MTHHRINIETMTMALLLALAGTQGGRAAEAQPPVSLAGTWSFELDRESVGVRERWFERSLAGKITLPGALQNQGFGDEITADTKWTGDVGSDRWKRRPEYAKYREPGNIKVPFFLQPEKHYVGAAWYQRAIEIPGEWASKRVVLTLERPHWGTQAWLDGQLIGTNLSLSTPHVYELGVDLKPGAHTLTVRVDNRVLVEVGDWSHSVSDHTQGNWNGVVGKIELSATDTVWIEDVQIRPNAAKGNARVIAKIGNSTGKDGAGNLMVSVANRTSPGSDTPAVPRPIFVKWETNGGRAEFEVAPQSHQTWDEFTPQLYNLTMSLVDQQTPGHTLDSKSVSFGLRSIAAKDRQFLINDRPVFFRGTLECCIFPKTGYPPTDVASWQRIIRICKSYGLNHIRFHSWCPPEAAFMAADEMGFYYQVECGVWTEPGSGKAIDRWLYDESQRIVRAYGNHPSFMLLTHGNEPHGPRHKEYLAQWVDFWKRDGRFLVTSGSAYPQLPENQYHVFYPSRGPHGWLGKDYGKDVEKLEAPVIVHEMGQWCVYPNFDEVLKYTGPLKPKNFDIFRDSLAEHGMLDQAGDFLRASGRLQVLCYKEEIEAALRTPGIGGVQLLDLHDFPGQGTALVGVLDPFWEEKGYVRAEEFRRFYAPVVPLTRLLKRTWTADETLACEVEVANFSATPIQDAAVTWRLCADDGKVAAQGEFVRQTLALGRNTSVGKIAAGLGRVDAPKTYRVVVEIADAQARPVAANDWRVWIYPAAGPTGVPDEVLTATSLDEAAQARLQAGGRVALFASKLSSEHPKLGFEPIFWNRYMFNTQERQTLGMLCEARHPALARFPTEDFQDWQWRDIVGWARAMNLDTLPRTLRPMVQPIDDWNTNRKLGLIFECAVGSGRLLVCSADLERNLEQRPAARQLRRSLLAYAAGEDFKPKVAVPMEDLKAMLERSKPSKMVRLGAKVLSTDSEDTANGNVAAHAIDGDGETFWHTRWQPANDPMPHEVVIDLGRPITLKGLTYLPRQDMVNGRITQADIYCADDPKSWGTPTAVARWAGSEARETISFKEPVKARYLKFVARAEVNRNPFAAVAEVDILTDDVK